LNAKTVSYNATFDITEALHLPSSKSISNRLLVLQALSAFAFKIEGVSTANDSQLLQKILNSHTPSIDVEDAGTTARFALAWACARNKETTIDGTARMRERPMGPLIESLCALGFNVKEQVQKGYLPVKIHPIDVGKLNRQTTISAQASSQFISALCLIGGFLPRGLAIKLVGKVPSKSYLNLTITMLKEIGIDVSWQNNQISIAPAITLKTAPPVMVEVDWSSAAFWYQFVALSKKSVQLSSLSVNSAQGDAILPKVFSLLGVKTVLLSNGLRLEYSGLKSTSITWNFENCPDLAPSVLFTCGALGVAGTFLGLETLRFKECDRVVAIGTGLQQMGCDFEEINRGTWELSASKTKGKETLELKGFNDHRMVMASAMLSPVYNNISVSDTDAVSKSYPEFWSNAEKVGIRLLP
jgi:3-phosphoshikimate 1-carboxyvinyltransferase